jgi:uncharacterized protein YxjI
MPSRSGRGHSEDPEARSAPEGSRYVLRVRDTYGVAVAPGQDDALVLAVTVCIDHLTSKDR